MSGTLGEVLAWAALIDTGSSSTAMAAGFPSGRVLNALDSFAQGDLVPVQALE